MKQKQVIDVRAAKSFTTMQSNEHLRIAANGAFKNVKSHNFDPSREHLNFEVKDGNIVPVDKKTSIPKRIAQSLAARGIINPNAGLKIPKYRTHADIILGGSREQMRKLAFGEQEVDFSRCDPNNLNDERNKNIMRSKAIEEWAIDSYNFMAKKFGKENIVAFVVHLDELNPHVHCTVLPVTERNKISWKKVFVGEIDSKDAYKKNMIKLHNDFSEINKKYDLERGEPIAETNAKHRTTEEYLKQQFLMLEDNVKAKHEEAKTLDQEIKHARARLKGLTTMIENLEKKIIEQEIRLKQLESDVATGKISVAEYNKKRQELIKELEITKLKKQDKEEKLSIAEKQLTEVEKQIEKKQEEHEKIIEKIKNIDPKIKQQIVCNIESVGWDMAAIDSKKYKENYTKYREKLPEHDKEVLDKAYEELFDGSLLEKMAEHTIELITIAANLYMGMIGEANKISHGCGGGSAPSSGWGNKDDEDDWMFRKRCMIMGINMLQSSSKKRQIKR